MYKNFRITEKEKHQILEMHQSHDGNDNVIFTKVKLF